jgi:hypothetical protein
MPDYFSCRTVINIINTGQHAHVLRMKSTLKKWQYFYIIVGKDKSPAVSQFGDYIALSQFTF